ncbi:hypothetical protein GOP97_17935 [Vibrio cholerae]|nr:hypothetical protein [Vibrio cholerae]MEB5557633.1 hypothetical protein [Vibrio cholerae]HBC3477456.1 hypothetical protein [Vibrio cholerae]
MSIERYQSKVQKIPLLTPSGNIFKVDRLIRTKGEESESDIKQESLANNSDKMKAKDFVMVSIVTQGMHTYAVFVSQEQRITLSEGESNDTLGTLDSIIGNRAITVDTEGAQKEWRLFPVGDNTPKEESPNQEENTTK